MNDPDTRAITAARARQAFYERIDPLHLTPLWEVLAALVPKTPTPRAQPAHWAYSQVREHLMEAGRLISAREAERRVLILENPGLRGASRITQSLYAGLQLILPGEVAPAHRHTQSALRLVLDGQGAYTAVDGERTTMRRGDFIITPAWTFHDHGCGGDEPVVWLDGLDIPLVEFLGAGFPEKAVADVQGQARPEGDAQARYGHNLVPVDYAPAPNEPTRLFVYPYTQTRAALDGIARGPIDAHHGFKLRYVNPATGASPMPTIGACVQRLPAQGGELFLGRFRQALRLGAEAGAVERVAQQRVSPVGHVHANLVGTAGTWPKSNKSNLFMSAINNIK